MLVLSKSLKLVVDIDFVSFGFLDFAFEFLHLILRLLNLFNDCIMAIVCRLQVSIVAPLLIFPLLLHFAFYLFLQLVVLFFGVLRNDLLTVCILVFDCLQLRVKLLLLALVLLSQISLKLILGDLLLLLESLSLLPDRVTDAFLHGSLTLPDSGLISAQSLVLGVFELVISAALLRNLSLPVSLKPDLSLFLNAFPSTLDLLLILAANLVDPLAMLGLLTDFLVLNLVAEEILLEQSHLLVNVARLLEQLNIGLGHSFLLNRQFLLVTVFEELDLAVVKILLLTPEVVKEIILGDLLALHGVFSTTLLLLTGLVNALAGQTLELLLTLLFALAFLGSLDLVPEAVLHIHNIFVGVLSDPCHL